MIIENGTIEIKQKTGGGLVPTTGFPIPVTVSWGNPISCQYYPNNLNLLGQTNGEHFTQAQYTILIEQQTLASAEQIRLKDKNGQIVGEFSIQSIEPLDAVCEIKLIV